MASRRAVGRSSLLLLVGLMLGMITMHSTPAMSMSGTGSGLVSSMSADATGHSLPSVTQSSYSPAVPLAASTVVREAAPKGPSPDHMLQPCLSDSTRSSHASLISPSVMSMTEQRGRTVPVTSPPDSQARSHPPSLHELCISRT